MENTNCDLLILGAGCAGLTAGIYGARSGRNTILVESGVPGGQAGITTRIENYPGLPDTNGAALTQAMLRQAEAFGARLIQTGVDRVDLQSKTVFTGQGRITGKTMILATGAVPRTLNIPGEAEFRGRGVSYCGSCDGFFYRGRDIYVVGGGNSAAEEALHLAAIGQSVRMLVRKDALRCEDAIRRQLDAQPNIQIEYCRALTAIRGTDQPEALEIRDTRTGETEQRKLSDHTGIFIFVGYRPASDAFREQLAMDADGYLLTNDRLQTSVAGVFAAGDVRQKYLRQIITAAADGAEAAHHAAQFLRENTGS